MRKKLLLFASLISFASWGQVNMTTTGSYNQDFNTLANAGSPTWSDNATIPNWFSQRTGTGTSYSADTGAASTGDLYSYGAPATTERALGSISSGTVDAGDFSHGLLLKNTSGNTITNLTVAYTGEQWRVSDVVPQALRFYYKISSSAITNLTPNNNTGWTAVPALNFTCPQTSAVASGLDGDLPANRVDISSVSIPSLILPKNHYIMIKWEDPNEVGTDQGMAIDDVTVAWAICTDTTWDGATWSTAPSPTTNLIFNGNYSSSGDLSGCSCTVNSGAVIFGSGHTLEIADEVVVSGGSLTFNNGASLVQTFDNNPNSGSINYDRNTSPVIHYDYTYWSSPTSGSQTLLSFSPSTLTDKFYTYHNSWACSVAVSDTFQQGIGYAIRAPQGTSPTVPTSLSHKFIGVPNNGDVDVAVALGPPVSNRLVGNPYPSTMDADAFISANLVGSGTINQTMSGTLYFWTHNHTLLGNNYSSSDYATYNLSGGTAVATGSGNTSAPTQYIASGQGFFVQTIANGNLSFRNSMRVGINNTNFYKNSSASNPTASLESHRIWLNLTNSATSSFSQSLIGYIQTATNDYDPGFDGLYFGANQFVLYSLINNDAYTIQARALPFANTDAVPMGYKADLAGNLTITIDHVDGLFTGNQDIYIEDQLLNVFHNLKIAPYTFNSAAGTFNNRFVLRYVEPTLGAPDFENIGNAVKIYASNNEIKMESGLQTIKSYTVYDVLGRVLANENEVNFKQKAINSIVKNNQALIVKVALENGQAVTKKIIF